MNRADQVCSAALFGNADLWLCPNPEANITLLGTILMRSKCWVALARRADIAHAICMCYSQPALQFGAYGLLLGHPPGSAP